MHTVIANADELPGKAWSVCVCSVILGLYIYDPEQNRPAECYHQTMGKSIFPGMLHASILSCKYIYLPHVAIEYLYAHDFSKSLVILL